MVSIICRIVNCVPLNFSSNVASKDALIVPLPLHFVILFHLYISNSFCTIYLLLQYFLTCLCCSFLWRFYHFLLFMWILGAGWGVCDLNFSDAFWKLVNLRFLYSTGLFLYIYGWGMHVACVFVAVRLSTPNIADFLTVLFRLFCLAYGLKFLLISLEIAWFWVIFDIENSIEIHRPEGASRGTMHLRVILILFNCIP